jgi:DNA-binding winged helix-turn-helix (wHTH) protein
MPGTSLQDPTASPLDTPLRAGSGSIDDARPQIRFRGFVLLPGARTLHRDGVPVDLGSRAFDLLQVLAEARGDVVGKNEIVGRVWPDTVVEESNLRYQVAVLRKALGRDGDLIKTVAGRGYLLVLDSAAGLQLAPWSVEDRLRPPAWTPAFGHGAQPAHLIPSHLTESREVCEALSHLLRAALDELWQITHGAPAQLAGLAGPAHFQAAD